MIREEALKLLQGRVKNKNLLKHMYAVEAVMIALARHFGEDEEEWGMTGLLHDIDYDQTKDDPSSHSLVGAEMLEREGFSERIVYAVKCHNDRHGLARTALLDKALFASDPVTGLIVAGALIHPEKRLASIDVPFLLNRFQEKSFARGANRDNIASCSDLGLSLEEFLDIALKAMQEIHEDLGL